ncbi:hypothetical protein ACFO0M_10000 [Micromonospora mangrovi]|uniref:Uncharacterized protein n=2 Tax=Micromonospora TaxID=1873 RepID=A0AAU8HAY4_9ACTN
MDDLTPPPAVTAHLDQTRAALVDLVAGAAEHVDADACPHAGVCPGDQVTDVLAATGRAVRDDLLRMAIAELARLGYTRPARYRLTRAAYAALDATQPRRPWPFGGRRA